MASSCKVPDWWPKNRDGEPLRYVYRAMRADLLDLTPAPLDRLVPDKESQEFRAAVMRALVDGSVESSMIDATATRSGARGAAVQEMYRQDFAAHPGLYAQRVRANARRVRAMVVAARPVGRAP